MKVRRKKEKTPGTSTKVIMEGNYENIVFHVKK